MGLSHLCVRDGRNRLCLRGYYWSKPIGSAPNLIGTASGIDAKGLSTFEFMHPEFFSGFTPQFCCGAIRV